MRARSWTRSTTSATSVCAGGGASCDSIAPRRPPIGARSRMVQIRTPLAPAYSRRVDKPARSEDDCQDRRESWSGDKKMIRPEDVNPLKEAEFAAAQSLEKSI